MPKKVTRVKTEYPGVYHLESKAADGRPEKIFYIIYRKGGKLIGEKAGRQHQDKMTTCSPGSPWWKISRCPG